MDTAYTHPAWLDRKEYPFKAHFFETPAGTMHYLDEGSGDPVVFVHGNPVWSFVYRNTIKALRSEFRLIAPDHIGFGLSDKPADWSYLPHEHAANLDALLESLDLHHAIIVVNDWGGPTGLNWAASHPERVKGVIVANSWLWPVDDDWYYQVFSSVMGGPVGKWLTTTFNFFVRSFMPLVFGDKSKLTQPVHEQYILPFGHPEERKGMWVFPGQITGASAWLRELWPKAQAALQEKRIILAWGMKDIAFREHELAIWQQAFPNARSVHYPDSGHYLGEEHPEKLAELIRELRS